MSSEDRIRFSFLLIITIIVFTMNVRLMTPADRRGLGELDAIFDVGPLRMRREARLPPLF